MSLYPSSMSTDVIYFDDAEWIAFNKDIRCGCYFRRRNRNDEQLVRRICTEMIELRSRLKDNFIEFWVSNDNRRAIVKYLDQQIIR